MKKDVWHSSTSKAENNILYRPKADMKHIPQTIMWVASLKDLLVQPLKKINFLAIKVKFFRRFLDKGFKINIQIEQCFYFQKFLLCLLTPYREFHSSPKSNNSGGPKRHSRGEKWSSKNHEQTFFVLIQSDKYAKMFKETSICIMFWNAASLKNLIVRTKL